MKIDTMKVRVYTEVGLLTAILVKDKKIGGYTIFFKDEGWDNLTTEGETIDESITNLVDLLNVVIKYKKERKSATDFAQWIWDNNIKPSNAVQGRWYHQQHGYIKTTEILYDMFVMEISKVTFNLKEYDKENI